MLSATCPAEAATPIRDLGNVTQDESARWLVDLVKQKDDALVALAVNRGNVARDALAGIARNDKRRETRKEAVFWLAQARGQSLAQMALAWTVRDPRVTTALIGASKVTQLEDNFAALQTLDFTSDELAQIDVILG